jgi:CRP-like cAMP-binding protein
MLLRRPDPIAVRLEALRLERAAAATLSRQGTVVDLAAGTVLCRQGERGTQAFVLLDGAAEVVTAEGRTIEIGAGDVVGELATLDPHLTRNATVTATTPLRVLVYDVATFRFLAQQDGLRQHLVPDRVAA